ncbi:unnamed protein product [Rhizoctonia solani]|nr:unnamed protein product [Rhizoctonia solani]
MGSVHTLLCCTQSYNMNMFYGIIACPKTQNFALRQHAPLRLNCKRRQHDNQSQHDLLPALKSPRYKGLLDCQLVLPGDDLLRRRRAAVVSPATR